MISEERDYGEKTEIQPRALNQKARWGAGRFSDFVKANVPSRNSCRESSLQGEEKITRRSTKSFLGNIARPRRLWSTGPAKSGKVALAMKDSQLKVQKHITSERMNCVQSIPIVKTNCDEIGGFIGEAKGGASAARMVTAASIASA